jgi:hypothetical protein
MEKIFVPEMEPQARNNWISDTQSKLQETFTKMLVLFKMWQMSVKI